jgi:stage II sporulation protein R
LSGLSRFNGLEIINQLEKDKGEKSKSPIDFGWISLLILSLALALFLKSTIVSPSFIQTRAFQQAVDLNEVIQPVVKSPEELIRFHVVANSDSEEDQALKRAVRDAILEIVSPQLAASGSLEESREILLGLRPEMEAIGKVVVESWGKNYAVRSEYGDFIFPTKSYGSLILPAGEYEAVRILIGEGKGSNWWCVLFPPLCFVDIEHSTAVAVDGKPGIPYDEKNSIQEKQVNGSKESVKEPVKGSAVKDSTAKKSVTTGSITKETVEKPKVRFWIIEFFAKLF